MGSTELNENETHERGYTRGFCPNPNVKSEKTPFEGEESFFLKFQ